MAEPRTADAAGDPAGEAEHWVEEGYEYWRQRYTNGRIRTWRARAETGKPLGEWEQQPDKLDKDVADLHKLDPEARTSASSDESVSAPPTQEYIYTRKPDGSLVPEKNKNYQPPKLDTITRPAPAFSASGEPIPGATETVSKAQADYDAGEKAKLVAKAQAAEQFALEDARNSIARDGLTRLEALDKYNADLDKIKLQLEQSSQALTQRGQDITSRGQDLSAAVSQRGQGLDYEQALAGNSTSLAQAQLQNIPSPGQIDSYNSLMGGGAPVAIRPGPLPFDPLTFPSQAAQAARAGMAPPINPGQFALPGAPAPAQIPQQFRLPA